MLYNDLFEIFNKNNKNLNNNIIKHKICEKYTDNFLYEISL
jgi:hypothetical protein